VFQEDHADHRDLRLNRPSFSAEMGGFDKVMRTTHADHMRTTCGPGGSIKTERDEDGCDYYLI